MQFDHLIIGQGICGTFLSWYLKKAGRSCIIIDELQANTASRVAAGIINPVTGRRIVKTWMIDQLFPFALQAYEQLGVEINRKVVEQKDIIDFFPTVQMKLAFEQRHTEDPEFVSLPADQNKWSDYFNADFGFGEISPCLLVNIPVLLSTYRSTVKQELRDEKFEIDFLQITGSGIRYKDITASSIIFCDGVGSINNPYFNLLPFAANKGEMIWIKSSEIPASNIFKCGINLVPCQENTFWVGSSYQWEFENSLPTEKFKQRTITTLNRWLKVPFTIVDHRASVRPATLERRPFVGFHPVYKNVGILNGMGTKGCSLAPFFARQLVNHIVDGFLLQPDVDILRFRNMLSKNNLSIT